MPQAWPSDGLCGQRDRLNPLQDLSVIGAVDQWFDAPPRDGVETIRVIMKDGVIYKNTLGGM